jgi:predicted nicotinamide N-methyase
MSPGALEAFIRERMTVSAPQGLEEVRLHLAGPATGLTAFLGEEAPQPCWAFVWGGGLALARHVLDRPETVSGRRVMDLGAGSGLVGIAAMKAGAASVTAVDIDPRAAVATRLNAGLNGMDIATLTADLLDGPAPMDVDVVLIGDLFYAPELAERVAAFVRRCQAMSLEILIGDPGRATLPIHDLIEVRRLGVLDFGGGEATGSIFTPREYSPGK